MAVLLFQERPTAWRRRPSQGDGGLDVGEPNSRGYHVYQIKGFTESRSIRSSRQRQVRESFERILDDPRLDRPVTGWSLVAPIDQTSEDEEWFRELIAHAPFPCDWKGQLFWDSEAAKHAHVIDYYLRDGKGRLEERVRDLQHLLARPGVPLRAVDVGGTLEGLRTAINRADPHYRYEFSTSATAPQPLQEAISSQALQEPGLVMISVWQIQDGGYLFIRVYARYPQALEDAPITGSMRIVVPRGNRQPGLDRFEDDIQAFLDFGRGLELPHGAIQDVATRAPAGLSMEAHTAAGVLGPAYLTEFRPHDERFQVVDGTGTVLAETTVRMTNATGGPRGGIEVSGVAAGGAFDVRIQLLPLKDQMPGMGRFTISGRDFVGVPVRHLLPGVRVMEALHAPNELVWRPEFGPAVFSRMALPTEAVFQLPTGFLPLLEAMNVIQEHTSIPIVMPDELMSEEVIDIFKTARLLGGEAAEGTWTRGSLTFRPESPDDVLDGIGPESALFFTADWIVNIGQVSIPLGPCYKVIFNPQVAEVKQLEDGSREVVFEPAEGEVGRAEERLGLPPGSPQTQEATLP
jgi:hypothetical protein